MEAKDVRIDRARMDRGSCSRKIVGMEERHRKRFYIRANRCPSLHDDMFAPKGWERRVINDVELEANSILVEKWGGEGVSPCHSTPEKT